MSKLLIKFWGKLGDTAIGVSHIFRNNDFANTALCLQNPQISNFAKLHWAQTYPMPKISKDLWGLYSLGKFLFWLVFFSRKFDQIQVLENESSIWWKILKILLFDKKISYLSWATNAYDTTKGLVAKGRSNECDLPQKSRFVLNRKINISPEVTRFSKERYILIGLWSETWTFRSPDALTWASFIKRVNEEYSQYTIALIGRWRNDQILSDEIIQKLAKTNCKIVSFVGETTINELAVLMSHSTCNVMVDSGLSHLAHFFNIPEVFVFGPDTPGRWFPKGFPDRHYYYNPLPCSPCPQNWYDKNAGCVNGNTGACLRSKITVEGLLRILKTALETST